MSRAGTVMTRLTRAAISVIETLFESSPGLDALNLATMLKARTTLAMALSRFSSGVMVVTSRTKGLKWPRRFDLRRTDLETTLLRRLWLWLTPCRVVAMMCVVEFPRCP